MEALGSLPQVIYTAAPQGIDGVPQAYPVPKPALDNGVSRQRTETVRDAFSLSNSRLVIERDPRSARWVYKTVDSKTGELLSQFPIKSPADLNFSRGMGLGQYYDARI